MDTGKKMDMLLARIKEYNPASNSELIRAAYDLAAEAHKDQKRDSGEPYIIHPLAVVETLIGMQIDDAAIIAGMLHDVIEDTNIPKAELAEKFGPAVVRLVEGVTKLSKLDFHTRHDAQAENLRRMFLAMSSDIRIILIKLADRLHNMRTIGTHRSMLRQKEIAEETLSIYAPLAHRLGMFSLKNELEDLSIAVLEPERIQDLKKELARTQPERDIFINDHINKIRVIIALAGIKGEVSGRTKNYYSIFNKMRRQQKTLLEIFDLNAVRVIVDEVKDCYAVLGVIHARWKPIPGRFKDYIAMPKQNLYQSLHTTVISDNGTPFEVQIRTWDMHRLAEFGVAAHWRYKEGCTDCADFDKKVEWLRQMLEWQQEVGDSGEFMESMRNDLFSENIYVFSPQGDVYELPAGSVPVDFAYRVHTNVGHQCVGAKINARLVPLDTPLNNGDIVEIMTAKGRGPSRDWLKICRTQQAKNKIRQWYRKEKRGENIDLGRDAFNQECKRVGIDPQQAIKSEKLPEIAKRFNCQSIDDLLAAIGEGTVRYDTVINKLKDEFKKDEPPKMELKQPRHAASPEGIVVEGLDAPMVHLAACCKPLPGEAIIGYITRGKGITVHREGCLNVEHYRETEPERLIEVSWADRVQGEFQVELDIICMDRERLLMDVMTAMAETKTAVTDLDVHVDRRSHVATMHLKMEVHSLDQLDYLRARLNRIKDVMETRRVVHQSKTMRKVSSVPRKSQGEGERK